MPNIALTNAASGEVSPIMLGRPDVGRYANALQRLENFLLTSTGMCSYRPGFRLMGLPKPDQQRIKLRKFQFSDEQGYMLEFGERYFRVWHTLGQVVNEGGSPIEVVTPYPSAELGLLGFTQSADYLFVAHEQRGFMTIERRSHTDWRINVMQFKDGPYMAINTVETQTLSLSGVTGQVTVTAAGFPGDKPPFAAGDEHRLIRVKDGAEDAWRWLIVDEVVSGTEVLATIQGDDALSSITADTPFFEWRLGLYSNRLGWPAAIILHERRLVVGGSSAIPDRFDGSAIGQYDVFAPGVNADDAYAFAIGGENVNRILAFSAANDLLAYTVGTVHRLAGDSTGIAITPTSIWQKPVSTKGTKRIPPVKVGNVDVSVDSLGLTMQALSYNLGLQSYAGSDLTLLADHMCFLAEGSPGFQALVHQGAPIGTIWAIRGNDELAGCMFLPEEQNLGWHRHPMGSAAGEQPVVESIETMIGPTHHELWAVVRRELPGRTLRTIERMDRPGLWDAPAESEMRLDCGLSIRNTPPADLTLAAATGNSVAITLTNADGFELKAADVGRFIKRRWLAGKTRKGRPIWKTGVAEIVARSAPDAGTVKILKPFEKAGTIAAGGWGLTVATVTGLDHFNGLDVTAVSDGVVCEPKTVVDGAIALDVPGWEVHAGLPYEGWLVTMPLDPGPSPAIGQGRMQRIAQIKARLVNSLGGEFGALPETEDEKMRWDSAAPYRQGANAPSMAAQAFSGDKTFYPAGAWSKRAELAVRQTQPLPFNVQLMVIHDYAPWVQP